MIIKKSIEYLSFILNLAFISRCIRAKDKCNERYHPRFIYRSLNKTEALSRFILMGGKNSFVITLIVCIVTVASYSSAVAQTSVYYVDKDANGNNDGSSWANAWVALNNINWASINPGDIVYVSGGTYDGTFTFGKSGTSGNLITVSGSYESGHNDEVIITSGSLTGIDLRGKSYIRINHLTIDGCDIGIRVSTGNTIYVDSIKVRNSTDRMFYASGNTGGSWSSNLFVRWCDLQTTSSSQADGIYIQWYWENIDIVGNLIVLENTGTAHMDGIQWSNYVRNIKVWNNWIQNNTPPSANRDSQGMMLASANGYIYIYNNVVYCPLFDSKSPCIYRTTYQGETGMYYVYNNTFITSASYSVVRFEVEGKTDFKNNIVMDINTPYTHFGGGGDWPGGIAWIWTPDDYSRINANLFTPTLLTSSTYQIGSNPAQRSMIEMYNLGAEQYGSYSTRDRVDPLFTTTVTGSLDFTDVNLTLQDGSPALDGGIDLQSEVEAMGMVWESFNNPYIVWATGGLRDGTPDIGVYDHTNGIVQIDTTPPELESAEALNSTKVELLFSEELESISAQNKSNYSINNGIVVNSATLSSDKKKVTLTSSAHTSNTNYIATVTNVKDLAGNVISSNNTAQYSFISNTIGDLNVKVKVYLHGPFQNGSMTTALYDNEVLSSTQPYNVPPWSYSGDEVLESSTPSSTVDWILVELRSSTDPSHVISRRAGLLRNDGKIMEPNGTVGLTFSNLLYGSYYVAIFHRNHLAVMTSVPVSLNPGNTLYNFSTAQSKAYGQDAMYEVSSGIFAMFASDGNGNGTINDMDRDDVWANQNGNLGYLNGDFNLDSGVTIKDVNDYWNLNNGKVTQVP